MSAPTVYLERDATGQVLVGLRLVGDSDAEYWSPPPDTEPAAVPALAAAWIRSQTSGRVGLLCLDTSGAVCSWLDTPSSEPGVVRAAARQAPPGMWGDWPSTGEHDQSLDWRATSMQPVGATDDAQPKAGLALRKPKPAERVSKRSAVLAVSDLTVRLLLDELDRAGVAVQRVASLWHAMSAAWDPAAAPADDSDDPLSARDTSDTAVVLVTAGSGEGSRAGGRLTWTWSSQGELLAAGMARLDADSLRGEQAAGSSAAGRLTADWLAWTAQLGRSPARIVCLADEDLGEGIAGLGRAIGSAWAGAAIDLFRVADPVGATLHRLRETSAGGKPTRPLEDSASVGELASRPGRAHKAMYRWAAAGLLAASGLCIGLGVQQRRSADDARVQAAALTGAQRERVAEVLPANTDLTYPALAAQSELDRLRAERATPGDVVAPPPILAGMEQISFVVSSTDVRLEQLTLSPSIASVVVSGPTTESVELLPGTLRGGTDLFEWQSTVRINQQRGRYRTSISGTWADQGPGRPEPGA